jgi:3-isopropylmalate/(R)-2-methylmalate dehydratase small subunit
MNERHHVTGTAVPLLLDDVDTDRIIPARYLRCVTFDGLGEHLFEDDRKQDPNHPFNEERFGNACILVAGRNFGCGSSREHAPQAMMRWGIKAVVAESFAEIFFGNCTSLGIPAVCAARADLDQLATAIDANPAQEINIDLDSCTIRCGDKEISCEMPASARSALTSGQWDFLSQLLENRDAIRQAADALPYMTNFP